MLDVRTSVRDDTRGRAAFVAPHLAAGHVPPPSRCMDPMCELRPGTMVEMLEQVKPCCHGDGTAGGLQRGWHVGWVNGHVVEQVGGSVGQRCALPPYP